MKRNAERFPEDFMFMLTRQEWDLLKCQIGISRSPAHGGRREKKYDEQVAVVFEAIKRLIAEDEARRASPKRQIGFVT